MDVPRLTGNVRTFSLQAADIFNVVIEEGVPDFCLHFIRQVHLRIRNTESETCCNSSLLRRDKIDPVVYHDTAIHASFNFPLNLAVLIPSV